MHIPRTPGSEPSVEDDTGGSPPTTTLFEALPDTKFIFPCARRQRATVYKRSIVRQWFDDWHLDPELSSDVVDSRYDHGLQTTGLEGSVEYLHGLINEERKLVGSARDVAIGGFSQGAATSLMTAILWDGSEALGGVVVMSGWLPYMKQLTDVSSPSSSHVEDNGSIDGYDEDGLFVDLDPFERPVPRKRNKRHLVGDRQTDEVDHTAIDWLREEIELPAVCLSSLSSLGEIRTPAMLCHGSLDNQVDYQRGEQACLILPNLGLSPITWRFHEGVDHNYCESMLFDSMQFLKHVFSDGI